MSILFRFLLLAALLLPMASSLFAADPPDGGELAGEGSFLIIRSDEKEHKLLKKTCKVCHREGEMFFFLVTADDEDSLAMAHETLSGKLEAPTSRVVVNPHSATMCLFCHLTPPDEKAEPTAMTFRTLDGKATDRENVADLCRMCHQDAGREHTRVIDDPESAIGDLVVAGLAEEGQSLTCSTCHDMHSKQVSSSSLKLGFKDFAKNSIHIYPHASKGGCLACHTEDMKPFGTPVFFDDDPVQRCVRCHAVRHEAVHATEVFSSEKTYPMDFLNFPLAEDGKTTCSTCHDEPCNEPVSERNRAFLRGGPYSAFTDFCYNCHPKAGDGGLSPHRQVDEKGNIVTSACVFCHIRTEDFELEDPGILAYKFSPLELCVKCHNSSPHPSGINHIVEISPEKKAKLEDYEERHRVFMPIDSKGMISCTTCHNPHDKGVTSGSEALGAEEELRWRVPSFAELCTPCHARYD
ncbi:MAG: hypothetical protein C0608_00155 [Deltaproteobacteria bacterium]|nr:MAG: hypothetical protein C0608_00155 [Deltaproteobacteria bacterium]